jgi:hypothetical protein
VSRAGAVSLKAASIQQFTVGNVDIYHLLRLSVRS